MQIKTEEQFQDLILANIKDQTIESTAKEKTLLLVFVIKNDSFTISFPLVLERVDHDSAQLFETYGDFIRSLDQKVEYFLKEIQNRFDALEQKLEAKNKDTLRLQLEKDEKKRREELEAEKAEYNKLKTEIFKDVSFLTVMKPYLQSAKNEDIEYLHRPFLPAQNNNQNVTLSNGNYTICKTNAGSWFGMKTDCINKEGKFIFSVRVDAYSSAYMIGFCISNIVNINEGTGYYATNQSFMFYMSSNSFYNKGSTTVYAPVMYTPQIGDIFSVYLDTKRKIMVLFSNGIQYGVPRPINLNDNEKFFLAPCVDISGVGTTITMVEFKEISI